MIKCDICIDSALKPCFNALFHTISVTLREAENNIIMTKLRFRKCKWPEIWQKADPGLKSRLSEAQSGAMPPWRGRACRDRSVLSHLAAKSFQSCPTLCDPHRRQPTRLPHPWDSPGKNTGVGCHFLLQCMKVKSESEVAQSCPTLSDPMDCSPPGSSVHGIFQAGVLEWVPSPSP